jgi:hypothetical protein
MLHEVESEVENDGACRRWWPYSCSTCSWSQTKKRETNGEERKEWTKKRVDEEKTEEETNQERMNSASMKCGDSAVWRFQQIWAIAKAVIQQTEDTCA